MFLKRKLLNTLGHKPNRSTSLDRLEKLSDLRSSKLGEYSPTSYLEIWDPRCEKLKGHVFDSRSLYLLEDAIIEPKQGLIYSGKGNLLEDCTPWPQLHVYNSFPWNTSKHTSYLEIDFAIYLTSNPYYHWLIEDLASTIHSLREFPHSPIIVYKDRPAYVHDFVSKLPNEIIYVKGPVRVKSLLMINKGRDSGWPHPVDLENLRSYGPFVKAFNHSSQDHQVYISRKNSQRSPKNENQIEELFQSKGYKSVRLEEFNLFEQITLLSNMTSMAGIHGAGLTNLIWMQNPEKLLDIANESYWTECFHRLAAMSRTEYEAKIYKGAYESEVPIDLIKNYFA
jgi:hypothetical protein